MIDLMLAALMQSSAAAPAWSRYQNTMAIAFACAETASVSPKMDLKDALVVGSPDGFPQHGKVRLLVHDPKLFLGPSGVSTFSWSDDKDGNPMISFFSDTAARDQHILLLKERNAEKAEFAGISGPLSAKPDHYYGCLVMRDKAAADFIGKFVGPASERGQ